MIGSQILVIGGGITGRLFQFLVPDAQVFDWGPPPARQPQLTRNYGTNYLWKPLDGLVCKPFTVVTEVDGQIPTPESIRSYKMKIGKGYDDNWGQQFEHVSVGYDLVTVPEGDIQYNKRAMSINPETQTVFWNDGKLSHYDMLISTVPLYALIAMMSEYPLGESLRQQTAGAFRYDPIYVRVAPRPMDARHITSEMYVNYLSDPMVLAYRTCDREGLRHYEALTSGGMLPTKKIVPGKIHPLPFSLLNTVMSELTTRNIFCFGRFASWDPNELTHQTYDLMQTFCRVWKL